MQITREMIRAAVRAHEECVSRGKMKAHETAEPMFRAMIAAMGPPLVTNTMLSAGAGAFCDGDNPLWESDEELAKAFYAMFKVWMGA